MSACVQCAAKLLPGQEDCPGCGAVVAVEPAEPEPDTLVGRTLAETYDVEAFLDEGSMGRVYRARQRTLDKPVAIKVLHPRLASDERIAKRFHREARTASRFSHPNSLQVIDFGETEDGLLYLAMELLDGRDLLSIIQSDAPLSPSWIASVLLQVLSAVEEAHHSGIIHRDLKPENIIVLERRGENHVKVCDFGIAKIMDADEHASSITMTGFVCGTAEYMAPEQARGDDVDGRADIYAAGCVLYQMLTGTVPFAAETTLGIITKHLMEAPEPPRKRAPQWHIPPSFEAICLRAMQKRPEDRYPSALAMSQDLTRAVRALGDSARLRLSQLLPDAGSIEAAVHSLPPARRTSPTKATTSPAGDASERTRKLGLAMMLVGGALAVAMWLLRP